MTIFGAEGTRRVSLAPEGAIIGRIPSCDIVLADRQVSREHARLYRDPFDRWILEDLGSRNGTWVGGRRVTLRAITPGGRISIGPFTLRLSLQQDQRILPDEAAATTTLVVTDGPDHGAVRTVSDATAAASANGLPDLMAVDECLGGVVSSADLYPEVCRCVAIEPGSAVLMLRATTAADVSWPRPAVLACHLGASAEEETVSPPADFPISRRVVAAVGESGEAAMASSLPLGGDALTLTAAGQREPRAIYCVPVTVGDDWVDLLYVDLPADRAEAAALDLVRTVGRRVHLTGRNLLQAEDAGRWRLLDDQLAAAREIQAHLIPKSLDFSPAVDLALLCKPALWVGGDYCDAWPLADGRIAFALGDVSGKGLPAAMVMSSLQTALRTALDFRPDPAEAMSHLSQYLKERVPSNIFVTMVVGLLDLQTGHLQYVNAGHILPVVVDASGAVSTLGEPANMPLGIVDAELVPDATVLATGTAVVLVSDGVTEARSPDGSLFGAGQVRDLLGGKVSGSCDDLVRIIAARLDEFRGHAPQQDDVTVLALRYRGRA
jgi:sigma-B regulation protein RsbU (phosphoserine phosphatase)